jgi:signal peptidase I
LTYAPPSATSVDGEPRAGRRSLGCAFEIIETLILTRVIYLVIHNFVAQPFEVQQNSMIPTISPQEYILIDKLSPRFGGYGRGDIIVFHPPQGATDAIPYIKRIIGLPGDTVTLENGNVLVAPPDGTAVHIDEPYVALGTDGEASPTMPWPASGQTEWLVPDNAYFVMGDNRTVSQDSRSFGPVADELIIGRAWLRYFPLGRIGIMQHPDYPAELDRSSSDDSARVPLALAGAH